MSFRIGLLETASPGALPVEIVERKGVGHPDTICDALAESFARGLAHFYLERFGAILHHNVDKGLLWGGAARPEFGGGEVTEPIEVYLAGRATAEVKGVCVPVGEIAAQTSREWLAANLRYLDPDRHVRVHALVRPSSQELVDLFLRGAEAGIPRANDTSFGVGYAPLDDLETVVLAVDRRLHDARASHPAVGEDVKVMGTRVGSRIALTVACALVSGKLRNIDEYRSERDAIRDLARAAASACTPCEVVVDVNAADGTGPEALYLTVTGTSAEAGDDGQVGRGNRVNGLITPYRPMTLEAAAGKNPISHVGKLYSVVSNRIAHALVSELDIVLEAQCCLVSQIGRPIDAPQLTDLKVRIAEGAALDQVEAAIGEIARGALQGVRELWRDIVAGDQRLF